MDEQSLSFRLLAILFPSVGSVAAGYFYARHHKPEMAVANRLNMDVFVPALVFAAMHLSNAPASPVELATTMVAGTLIGALWTALYAWTRSLWVVTAHHACWRSVSVR